MTLEGLFVREYDLQKAKNTALTQELAAKDMQLQRLKETIEVYLDDIKFMTGLFEFHDTYAHAYISKVDPEEFDRLKVICGFEEEENVSGSD